jgi:hypothetical protein
MDWMPAQEEKLLELMAIWQDKLADSQLQTAYLWPADECTAVKTAMTAFTSARSEYQAAPTGANHTEKEETRKAAISDMRKFARERVRNNSKMSDGQKQELGVNTADREPSPIPVPGAGPEGKAEITADSPGVVRVKYLGAKPYGVDRVEIAWLISDAFIDSPDQLINHETFTRNPWEHTFGHEERAQKMYYSLRYLTREGKSAWSQVRETVIP